MLLIYGNVDPKSLNQDYKYARESGFLQSDCIAFNISTYREGYFKLTDVLPPRAIGVTSGYDFDMAYANYILSNDLPFCEFFSIIYHLYINKEVYLLVNTEEWGENVIESLLKLIQQRYGINAVLVNSEEDYQYAKMSANVSFSSGPCLWNLDTDKERYTATVTNMLMNGYNQIPVLFDFNGE